MVERPVAVRQLERLQPERLRELSRDGQRVVGLAADRRPGAVELSRIAAPVERLQRMEREAALVRIERRERRRPGDVSHPGTSRCQAPRHVGNGRVRDAEEDDVGIVLAHGDAALAQAGGDGRTDAARTDDVDSLDHFCRSSSEPDAGHGGLYADRGRDTCHNPSARMSSAAASLSDFLRLSPRRELLLGAALTAVFAALVLAVGPAPGDAPVHLYRTFLVRDGALVWDNFWYAGTYPLASYSLLYYLPAALVGNLPLVFAAAVASTVLFSSIALREWGRAALWPSRVFGVLAAAPMFTGLYAYSLGFTAMLATLKLLQLRRLWLAVLVAALTVGLQPARVRLPLPDRRVVRRLPPRRSRAATSGSASASPWRPGSRCSRSSSSRAGTGVYPFHWIDFVARARA